MTGWTQKQLSIFFFFFGQRKNDNYSLFFLYYFVTRVDSWCIVRAVHKRKRKSNEQRKNIASGIGPNLTDLMVNCRGCGAKGGKGRWQGGKSRPSWTSEWCSVAMVMSSISFLHSLSLSRALSLSTHSYEGRKKRLQYAEEWTQKADYPKDGGCASRESRTTTKIMVMLAQNWVYITSKGCMEELFLFFSHPIATYVVC